MAFLNLRLVEVVKIQNTHHKLDLQAAIRSQTSNFLYVQLIL
jgi:hypothetical protein